MSLGPVDEALEKRAQELGIPLGSDDLCYEAALTLLAQGSTVPYPCIEAFLAGGDADQVFAELEQEQAAYEYRRDFYPDPWNVL